VAKIDPTLDDLTPEQLRAIMPRCDVPTWHPLLVSTMGRYGIVTPVRVAAFLAQVAHESGELRRLEEGMSYSCERLMQVWPKRFPTTASATPYAKAPEALANHVYGSRSDLGNRGVTSGDGWRYRGGGPIQLTGRAAYEQAGITTGYHLLEHPELLRVPGPEAADSAGWFWRAKGCNKLADACLLDATPEQFRRAYPMAEDVLAAKDREDPRRVFRNMLEEWARRVAEQAAERPPESE